MAQYDTPHSIILNYFAGQTRNEIAEEILRYIEFHTESSVKVNSLKVLRELFA